MYNWLVTTEKLLKVIAFTTFAIYRNTKNNYSKFSEQMKINDLKKKNCSNLIGRKYPGNTFGCQTNQDIMILWRNAHRYCIRT